MSAQWEWLKHPGAPFTQLGEQSYTRHWSYLAPDHLGNVFTYSTVNDLTNLTIPIPPNPAFSDIPGTIRVVKTVPKTGAVEWDFAPTLGSSIDAANRIGVVFGAVCDASNNLFLFMKWANDPTPDGVGEIRNICSIAKIGPDGATVDRFLTVNLPSSGWPADGGFTVDSDGNFYVLTPRTHMITKISADGTVDEFWFDMFGAGLGPEFSWAWNAPVLEFVAPDKLFVVGSLNVNGPLAWISVVDKSVVTLPIDVSPVAPSVVDSPDPVGAIDASVHGGEIFLVSGTNVLKLSGDRLVPLVSVVDQPTPVSFEALHAVGVSLDGIVTWTWVQNSLATFDWGGDMLLAKIGVPDLFGNFSRGGLSFQR